MIHENASLIIYPSGAMEVFMDFPKVEDKDHVFVPRFAVDSSIVARQKSKILSTMLDMPRIRASDYFKGQVKAGFLEGERVVNYSGMISEEQVNGAAFILIRQEGSVLFSRHPLMITGKSELTEADFASYKLFLPSYQMEGVSVNFLVNRELLTLKMKGELSIKGVGGYGDLQLFAKSQCVEQFSRIGVSSVLVNYTTTSSVFDRPSPSYSLARSAPMALMQEERSEDSAPSDKSGGHSSVKIDLGDNLLTLGSLVRIDPLMSAEVLYTQMPTIVLSLGYISYHDANIYMTVTNFSKSPIPPVSIKVRNAENRDVLSKIKLGRPLFESEKETVFLRKATGMDVTTSVEDGEFQPIAGKENLRIMDNDEVYRRHMKLVKTTLVIHLSKEAEEAFGNAVHMYANVDGVDTRIDKAPTGFTFVPPEQIIPGQVDSKFFQKSGENYRMSADLTVGKSEKFEFTAAVFEWKREGNN